LALIEQHESGLAARQAAYADREREIGALYASGMEMTESAKAAGSHLGLWRATESAWAYTTGKPYKTPTFADLCDVRRRAARASVGFPRQPGFSEATIQKLATNLLALHKLQREWELVQEARALRASGQLYKYIAAEIGRNRDAVVALLKRYDGIAGIETDPVDRTGIGTTASER